MQAISYTHAGLVLLLEELGLQLSKPLKRLLGWLRVALLEKTTAHLVRLAEKLPDDDTQELSRRQRVRRFLSNPRLDPVRFVGILVQLMRSLLVGESVVVVILDRTEWIRRGIPIQILNVAVWVEGRAVPVYWKVENRKGNTSLAQWKEVLTPALEALRAADWTHGKRLLLVADREYASPALSQWLWEAFRVDSIVRMKRSEYLHYQDQWTRVSQAIAQLQPGQQRFLRRCKVTQHSAFVMNVALFWGNGYDEPWVLMTTCSTLKTTLSGYRKRWGIEPMHKDWKTNAFDLEGTRVTDAKRIATLLIPVALCYVLCTLEGARKEDAGESLRAHKENRPRGVFLEGLAAFCRVLRATTLDRIQQFFERLCEGWLGPHRLAYILQTKSVTY